MAEETTQRVPFMDLGRAHREIAPEILESIARLVESSAFIGARHLEAFEEAFASYTGARGAVGCSSGTQSLVLGLRAMGVGPGDEVITAVNTFIATVEAIFEVGARPVLVDVEEDTALATSEAVRAAITPRTRAVIAVHLYGQPVDLEALETLCKESELHLLQDAAQAHGARWNDRSLGDFEGLQSYSFYPGKNLGAWGDAGAICGSSPALLEELHALRDHGRSPGEKYLHHRVGTNARLDVLQALVIARKLEDLEPKNEERRQLAAAYRERLEGVGDLAFLECRPAARPVHHLLVVRTRQRDALREHLAASGISTGVHYPVPLHLQPALAGLELEKGRYPVAESLAETSLSLPFFPEMREDELDHVTSRIREFFEAV